LQSLGNHIQFSEVGGDTGDELMTFARVQRLQTAPGLFENWRYVRCLCVSPLVGYAKDFLLGLINGLNCRNGRVIAHFYDLMNRW